MTDEQIASHVNAGAVIAFVAMQGMIAENQRRAANGEEQAYGEGAFFYVQSDLEKVLEQYNFLRPHG
jgi:hypothetical protein